MILLSKMSFWLEHVLKAFRKLFYMTISAFFTSCCRDKMQYLMPFEVTLKLCGTILYHLTIKISIYSVWRLKMALKQQKDQIHVRSVTLIFLFPWHNCDSCPVVLHVTLNTSVFLSPCIGTTMRMTFLTVWEFLQLCLPISAHLYRRLCGQPSFLGQVI